MLDAILSLVIVVGLLLAAFGLVLAVMLWWLSGDVPEGPRDGRAND